MGDLSLSKCVSPELASEQDMHPTSGLSRREYYMQAALRLVYNAEATKLKGKSTS